ncbi:hypothetical protein, partial [Tepidimonas fonticaldi]
GVEIGDEPVRDTIRRPLHPRTTLNDTRTDSETAPHTKNRTSPMTHHKRVVQTFLNATDHLDMRQIKPDVTHDERQEQTLKLNPN